MVEPARGSAGSADLVALLLDVGELEQDVAVAGSIERTPACKVVPAELLARKRSQLGIVRNVIPIPLHGRFAIRNAGIADRERIAPARRARHDDRVGGNAPTARALQSDSPRPCHGVGGYCQVTRRSKPYPITARSRCPNTQVRDSSTRFQ